MHPGKLATRALLGFEAFLDFVQHLLFIHLGGAILCQARHAGLGSIPVALAVQVEMRRLVR